MHRKGVLPRRGLHGEGALKHRDAGGGALPNGDAGEQGPASQGCWKEIPAPQGCCKEIRAPQSGATGWGNPRLRGESAPHRESTKSSTKEDSVPPRGAQKAAALSPIPARTHRLAPSPAAALPLAGRDPDGAPPPPDPARPPARLWARPPRFRLRMRGAARGGAE